MTGFTRLSGMADNRAILQMLRSIDDVTVDRAMIAALATSKGKQLQGICDSLMKRGRREGLTGLVLNYHTLPSEVQGQMVGMIKKLYTPMRVAASQRNSEGPANVLEIIRTSKSMRLSYLIGEQLRHGTDATRDLAAYSLVELARTVREQLIEKVGEESGGLELKHVPYLERVIDESVVLYDSHLQPGVLVAMCGMMPRRLNEAMHVLGVSSHTATSPMKSLMRQSDDKEVRSALLMLMQIDGLGRAGLDGIRGSIGTGRFGDCLTNWHMLKLNAVRNKVEHIKHTKGLWTGWSEDESREQVQLGEVQWLDSLPIGSTKKADLLSELAGHDNRLVRLIGIRSLLKLANLDPNDAVDDAIAGFVDDKEVSIARIAVWHLIRCKYKGLAVRLAGLVNSKHEQIREIAGKHLGPLGFQRLWENWDSMGKKRKLAAGRALIKISPDFHIYLEEKLRRSDTRSKLRSISMIDLLNQGEFFDRILIQLSYHMDDKVRASAIKSLGAVQSHEAANVIEQALSHQNDRVRANAIEAIAAYQTPELVTKLLSLTKDDANRARANAIGVLMQSDPEKALNELKEMLMDKRTMHRVSALWLVEVLGLIEVAKDVAEMSISDPNTEVQKRADRVVHELMRMMNASKNIQIDIDTISGIDTPSCEVVA